MRKEWSVILGWLLVGVAVAGGKSVVASDTGATTQQLEASMLVSGTVSVDANGGVSAYTLYKRAQLPEPVRTLLDQTLPTFRFKAVVRDGQAQAVEAKMSLQVVANQIDPQHIALRLRSARFTEAEPPKTDLISIHHRASLSYPPEALAAGVRGTVYVALRIDRSGHVADVQVQQVNLQVTDTESRMQHWRDVLAENAMAGARRFTFNTPTTGKHAHDEFVTGILPVRYFVFYGEHEPDYGRWDSYVPGPKREIAWLHDDEDQDAANSEAVPDGEFAMTGDSLQLLTPLGG